MYTHTLKKLVKNTSEITVDIDKESIEKEYKITFLKLLQNFEMPGFRKGKVPANIAEKHIKKEAVYEELIRTLIPNIYSEIIKKESVKPVLQPKVDLIKANEKEDWQIKITVAEKPSVELGNYKEAIKKIKAEQKKDEIWTPGKQSSKSDDSEKEKSKKKYKSEIEQTYKLEFILAELADKENIKVENSDLEKLFSSISDPKEKEAAKANSYFYASVLRKQKTLHYLLN